MGEEGEGSQLSISDGGNGEKGYPDSLFGLKCESRSMAPWTLQVSMTALSGDIATCQSMV